MSYASIIAAATVRWNGAGDTPNDQTANGYDGTWAGTPAYGTAPYGSGKAFLFDGTNNITYIDLPTSFTSRSMSFWFKTTSSTADMNVCEHSTSTTNKIALRLNAGTAVCCVDSTVETTAVTGLNDGEWHHVVIVVEIGVETRFYIDNVLVGTLADAGNFSTPNLYAGSALAFNNDYVGELYDIIVDGAVAWSTGDIADLYAEGVAAPDTDKPVPSTPVVSVDGAQVTTAFDEAVFVNVAPMVQASGGAVTLTLASGDGTDSPVWDTSRDVQYHESLVLSFASGDVEDAAGNLVDAADLLVQNDSKEGLAGGGGVILGGGTLGRRIK